MGVIGCKGTGDGDGRGDRARRKRRASKRRKGRPSCVDCFFHCQMLCALDLDEPCSTFRPNTADGLVPPRQPALLSARRRRSEPGWERVRNQPEWPPGAARLISNRPSRRLSGPFRGYDRPDGRRRREPQARPAVRGRRVTSELGRLAKVMRESTLRRGRGDHHRGPSGVGFFVIEDGNATVSLRGEIVRTLGPGRPLRRDRTDRRGAALGHGHRQHRPALPRAWRRGSSGPSSRSTPRSPGRCSRPWPPDCATPRSAVSERRGDLSPQRRCW